MAHTSAVIVLTDFRLKPLLTALVLSRSEPNSSLLTTSTNLQYGDFGDTTRPATRRFALGVVRLFAKVEIIGAPLESPHTGACKGCMTSLVSMTRDAAASAALYPDLWSRLGRLCAASHTMAKHLSASGVRNLFIYNGRVASVRAISRRFSDSDDHNLRVYEYGSKFGTYRIARYSIHDFAFRSEQLVDYAKKTIFAFDEKRASKYIEQKLKNRFTRTYSSEPVPHYETVLFGGTPYEYSNSLDAGDHLDSDPLLMLRTTAAHPD